ncbi:oxidase [Beijerinckia sp. L45]|uniref:oxidase n=1 Tax=Beijerinckia sp. L45 TaxID=1641855 RepID=UPI001FF04E00|nr:oxidase [Beijerinckia sp. L45]
MTPAEKRELWRHMREPAITFAVLLAFLAINVTIGWLQPFPAVWAVEGAIMVLMIATVLLFSMEVIEEPALIKFFSILGFVWVAILFGMTMIDYVTR